MKAGCRASLHPALVMLLVAAAPISAMAQAIIVGPNIAVSKDPHTPHAETTIAVNPLDSRNLVGASIAFSRSDGGTTCRVFVSHDGGNTWTDVRFEEDASYGGADPQVVFGPDGVVYFLWIAHTTVLGGSSTMPLYRSADGGRTWQRMARLGVGDHPMLVVDPASPRFAGRLYGSAMYGVRKPGLFWTGDGGRTMNGPVFIPNPENHFLLDDVPVVLSDGTLFLPYRLWDDDGGTKSVTRTVTAFVLSHDGGQTFSPLRSITDHPLVQFSPPKDHPGTFIAENPAPVFAVDRAVHVDRIYMAWSDIRSGKPRVYTMHSDDQGESWSQPTTVSPNVPSWSAQYLPMLAVARDGTVALAWQDTRGDSTGHSLDYFFTASRDGVRTFLPARRISSTSSRPFAGGNRRLVPNWVNHTEDGRLEVAFNSAYRRWPEGGDYMGMAVEGDGVFHPLWADSRTGVFQLMTARIQVADSVVAPEPNTAALVEKHLGKRVEVLFESPQYDAATSQTTIRVSLRNVSDEIIHPPLRVHLDSLTHLRIRTVSGISQVVDYTTMLRDLPFLKPAEVTEAIEWILDHEAIREIGTVRLTVKGRIR